MRVIGKAFAGVPELTQYRAGGFMFELDNQSEWLGGNAHMLRVYTDDSSDDPPLDIIECYGEGARRACIRAMERFLQSPRSY